MTISAASTQLLTALLDAAEGEAFNGFRDVYLDNVKRPEGMTPHQFAGHLAALTEAGFYKAYDDPDFAGTFGRVKAMTPALARVWARRAKLAGVA